jgi:hypothetical protein
MFIEECVGTFPNSVRSSMFGRNPLMVALDPNTWALMQVRFDKR